jgi:hypothetical protein
VADSSDFLANLTKIAAGGVIGKLTSQFGGLTSTLGKLAGGGKGIAGIGAALQKLSPQADAAANGLNQGRNALGQFTAAGTGAQGMLGQLGGGLSSLGPYGIAAAAALAVLTAALTIAVGAMLAGAATAIMVTQHLAMMRAGFGALAGSEAGGAAVTAMVERLGQSLPFATTQVAQWAASLQAAGVSADKLESRIKAVAAATALTQLAGGGGGAAATAMFKRLAEGGAAAQTLLADVAKGGKKSASALAEMGLRVEDLGGQAAVAKMTAGQLSDALAKALTKKGAGPLATMGLDLDVIAGKAKEGLLSLFDKLGPSVEPFMAAVKSLFGEFSKGGSVVAVLKPIVTTVFTALFAWGTRALTAIRAGLLQVIIWGLQAYIALHPMLMRLKEFMTSATFITGLKTAFVLLAIVVGLAALPFIMMAVTTAIAIVALTAVVAAIVWVVGAIVGFVSDSVGALSGWASSAADAAGNFISGLVDGIVGGIGSVISAVTGLGGSMKSALFSALGIHSPSKIAIEAATNVTDTTSDYLDKGSAKVQTSIDDMTAPDHGGGKNGAGVTFRDCFNNCVFGEGYSKAQLEEDLADIFQRQTLAAPS